MHFINKAREIVKEKDFNTRKRLKRLSRFSKARLHQGKDCMMNKAFDFGALDPLKRCLSAKPIVSENFS